MQSRIRKITCVECHRIANDFLQRIGYTPCRLPIDISDAIEEAGYDIIPIEGLWDDYHIKGVVLKKSWGFSIGIDKTHLMEEERSWPLTLAEELSHILVHSQIFSAIRSPADVVFIMERLTAKEYRMIERQARSIGSCLLLPDGPFQRFILDFCRCRYSEIESQAYCGRTELAGVLARILADELNLSSKLIRWVLTRRCPAPLLIDRVLDLMGPGDR